MKITIKSDKKNILAFNKEELIKEIDSQTKKLSKTIVTEDNKVSIKNDLAKVRKLKKELNTFRIEKTKKFSEPLEKFKADIKELTDSIDSYIEPVKQQLDNFTQLRIDTCKTEVEKYVSEALNDKEYKDFAYNEIDIMYFVGASNITAGGYLTSKVKEQINTRISEVCSVIEQKIADKRAKKTLFDSQKKMHNLTTDYEELSFRNKSLAEFTEELMMFIENINTERNSKPEPVKEVEEEIKEIKQEPEPNPDGIMTVRIFLNIDNFVDKLGDNAELGIEDYTFHIDTNIKSDKKEDEIKKVLTDRLADANYKVNNIEFI